MASETGQSPEQGGVRESARAMLSSKLDEAQLNTLFDEVLAITKSERGWCPECKKAVRVEIPDARSVVGALADLVTKIADLPKDAEQGERIVFQRLVDYGDEPADS